MPAATALVPQVTPHGPPAGGQRAARHHAQHRLRRRRGARRRLREPRLDGRRRRAGRLHVPRQRRVPLGRSSVRAARRWPSGTSFLSELREGFAEVRRHRWLWLGLLNAFLFLMIVVAPFEVIGPVVAKSELGGAFSWGVILTGFSVGTLLGGLVMLRVRLERPMFVAGMLFFATCFAPLLLALPGAGLVDRARLRGRGVRGRHLRDHLGDRAPAPHPARDARARRRMGLARHDRRHAARLRAHGADRRRRRARRRRSSASRSRRSRSRSCSSSTAIYANCVSKDHQW